MDERLIAIKALHDDLLAEGVKDHEFEIIAAPIRDDLRRIVSHLLRNPDDFRKTRSLHAVHVPSLAAAVHLRAQMDADTSIGAVERADILVAFRRAAQLFRTAREMLGSSLAREALLEISVLADYAPPLQVPATPAHTQSAETRSGWAARATARLKTAARVDRVASLADSAWSDISTRSAGVIDLGGALGRSISGMISDNVTSPVAMRLGASSRAIGTGIGVGGGLGIAIGVLCPPLLPVAAGGAVLAALSEYGDAMAKARHLTGEAREAREAEIQTARKDALRRIAGGAESMQIETGELSLTIDAETGKADAVILEGAKSGRSFSSLSKAEQDALLARTRKRCDTPVDMVLNILTLGVV